MRVGLARLGTSLKLWSTCYDIIYIVYTYTISVPRAGNFGVLCDDCLSMVPQVTETQLLVLLLFRPSFVILHLFL